jgi:hypothetical protein
MARPSEKRITQPGAQVRWSVFPNALIPQPAWLSPAQHLLQYIPSPNVGTSEYSNASATAQRW